MAVLPVGPPTRHDDRRAERRGSVRRLLVVPVVALIVLMGPAGGVGASVRTASTAASRRAAGYKAACLQGVSYKQLQLMKESAAVKGRCISEKAQVFQYGGKAGAKSMLVDITDTGGGIWDTTVEVDLVSASAGRGIRQDDIIHFWGQFTGSARAKTEFGGSITVPVIDAKYVTLISSGATTSTTQLTT